MKNKRQKLISLMLLLAFVVALPVHSAYAASSIYVALSSRTINYGNTFIVGIRMNSGSPVNAVQANIIYPDDKLTYVSSSFAGSAFEIQAEFSAGGGNVRIARGSTTTLSGDNSIAEIVFRAKTDSGSATISVSSDSSLVNNGDTVSSGGSSATINFGAAPPRAPAAPAAPEPVADTTPPKVTEIAVTELKQTSATVNFKTDEAADSVVEYGPTNAYGLSVSSTEKVSAHKLILSSTFILPKTTYHYRVTSADQSGNKVVTEDKTFTTSGYPVLVIVVDKKGKPVPGVTVTIDGASEKTNAKGSARLSVTPGNKTVAVCKDKQSVSGSITVENDPAKTAKVQLVIILRNNFAFVPYLLGGLGIFGLGALVGALLFMRRKPKTVASVMSVAPIVTTLEVPVIPVVPAVTPVETVLLPEHASRVKHVVHHRPKHGAHMKHAHHASHATKAVSPSVKVEEISDTVTDK